MGDEEADCLKPPPCDQLFFYWDTTCAHLSCFIGIHVPISLVEGILHVPLSLISLGYYMCLALLFNWDTKCAHLTYFIGTLYVPISLLCLSFLGGLLHVHIWLQISSLDFS